MNHSYCVAGFITGIIILCCKAYKLSQKNAPAKINELLELIAYSFVLGCSVFTLV